MDADFAPLASAGRPRAAFGELDRVTTREEIETGTGRLARGSSGTIVAVWAGGEAYEVEFVRPVQALVTLRPSQIEGIAAA